MQILLLYMDILVILKENFLEYLKLEMENMALVNL